MWRTLPPAAEEAVQLMKAEARLQAKREKVAAAEQRKMAQREAEDAAAEAAAEGGSAGPVQGDHPWWGARWGGVG